MKIFCADIGSVRNPKNSKFGWASSQGESGRCPDTLVRAVVKALKVGPASLGFECPMWIPVPAVQATLGACRPGEKGEGQSSRPWNAGAGAAVLATGLTQAFYILDQICMECTQDNQLMLKTRILQETNLHEWRSCSSVGTLFLWEAFVSNKAPQSSDDKTRHIEDARLGAIALFDVFNGSEVGFTCTTKPELNERCFSIAGAACLHSGVASDLDLLYAAPLVVRVSSPT